MHLRSEEQYLVCYEVVYYAKRTPYHMTLKTHCEIDGYYIEELEKHLRDEVHNLSSRPECPAEIVFTNIIKLPVE